MTIHGLHHITLVASNAQQTVDFYVGVLGLSLVKKTVNFDDPGSYHLYFGNEQAEPGSLVTFFEWPNAPKGTYGIGGTHHLALRVGTREALLKWKRYLQGRGLSVKGIYNRNYFESIYFQDPDGQWIEIATDDPGFTVDESLEALGTSVLSPPDEHVRGARDQDAIDAETWPDTVPGITPDMALKQGMHHISAISSDLERTHVFYADLLGMRRVKMTQNFDDPNSGHWYWGSEDGRPGTLITYFGWDPSERRRARMGRGQTHHIAFSVADEAEQLKWRERILSAGLRVSPVMDRIYFKSIYTADPDGHIIELATAGPGFAVDEAPDALGRNLMLPPWLEDRRKAIETRLRPIELPVLA